MKNKNTVKLLVVAGIGLAILGIWFAKNMDRTSQTAATEDVTEEATEIVTEAATEAATEEATEAKTEIAEVTEPATEATESRTEAAGTETAETESEAVARPEDAARLPLQSEHFDFEELTSYGLPIMLDFGADDCAPCRQMKPDLESFYEKTKGTVLVQYYDVWKKPELAADFPVQAVPTQFFFMPDGSPYVPSEEMMNSGLQLTGYSNRETGEYALTGHVGILTEEEMRLILADMGYDLP